MTECFQSVPSRDGKHRNRLLWYGEAKVQYFDDLRFWIFGCALAISAWNMPGGAVYMLYCSSFLRFYVGIVDHRAAKSVKVSRHREICHGGFLWRACTILTLLSVLCGSARVLYAFPLTRWTFLILF